MAGRGTAMEREIRSLHGSDTIIETDGEDRPTGRRYRVVKRQRVLLEGWPQWLRVMAGLLGIGVLIPWILGALAVGGLGVLIVYFTVASFFH